MRGSISPALIALVAAVTPIVAQQPPQVFRAETEAVVVTATVGRHR